MKLNSKASSKFYRQFFESKSEMPGKIRSVKSIYKKQKVTSTTYKLSEYNFWWKCLEFSDKMNQTIQMDVFGIVKHCHSLYFKFGERFFTFLTMLGLQAKASICSKIKGNLSLYCREFLAFLIAVIIYFNNKVCLTKKYHL